MSDQKPPASPEASALPSSVERAEQWMRNWRVDERWGSVITTDTDGDDLVIFKSRNDHRGAVHSVLDRKDERKAMLLGAAAPDLFEAAEYAVETIRAVANEIGEDFKHSARAHSLTVVARDLSRAIAKATRSDEGEK
jgi:hypothetical protein